MYVEFKIKPFDCSFRVSKVANYKTKVHMYKSKRMTYISVNIVGLHINLLLDSKQYNYSGWDDYQKFLADKGWLSQNFTYEKWIKCKGVNHE